MTKFFLQFNIKLIFFLGGGCSFGNVYHSFSSLYFSSWIMMLKLKVFLIGSMGLDHWYSQLHQLGLGWFEIDCDNQECGLIFMPLNFAHISLEYIFVLIIIFWEVAQPQSQPTLWLHRNILLNRAACSHIAHSTLLS